MAREELAAGASVRWDGFAEELDRAAAALGGASGQRDAIERFVGDVVPVRWPVFEGSTRDLGPGFLLVQLQLQLPAPQRLPRRLVEPLASSLAALPTRVGAPAARILDAVRDEDGRRLRIWLELSEEHTRAPLGPEGDRVAGMMLIPSLDAAELEGVDLSAWKAEHGLDRAALLANVDVSWDATAHLARSVLERLGRDGVDRMMETFVTVTREASEAMAPTGDLESVYRGLHGDALVAMWRVVDLPRVLALRPDVLAVRMQFRVGVAPADAFFVVHAAALRAFPRHLGLPCASVATHLDDDGAGATYVVELPPEEAAHPALERSAHPGSSKVERLAEATIGLRHAARTAVVERLGRTLAASHDVHAVAEVVIDTLMSALPIEAIQVEIATAPGGPLVPLRARGRRTSSRPVVRRLEHAGRTLGALSCWGEPEELGNVLAALDLLVPWVAVGFGTALTLAWERHERAQLAAERDGLVEVLDGVLGKHPGCAFVIDDTGRVHAANDLARRALASDGTTWVDRLAHLVGEPRSEGFDVLPVRIGARVDRIVVLERQRLRSFEDRIARASERWSLTARQREVVASVARGMSNKEIAAELGCAEVTVENHLTAIFRKAGVDGRQRLVAAMSEDAT